MWQCKHSIGMLLLLATEENQRNGQSRTIMECISIKHVCNMAAQSHELVTSTSGNQLDADVRELIKNAGTVGMKYIEVSVTIYDENKEVVMTDVEYMDGELAANGTMDFEFEVKTDDRASSFVLSVQGSEID